MIKQFASKSSSDIYQCDTDKKTCTCPGFKFSNWCCHLQEAVGPKPQSPQSDMFGPHPTDAPAFGSSKPVKPASPATKSQDFYDKVDELEAFSRTRLSKNFIMRDFLFSGVGSMAGIPAMPDDPDHVIASGRALCEKVLEPLKAAGLRFSITYGYINRETMDLESPHSASKPRSSRPHHWDRKTFGDGIYCRVDILPYNVEDKELDRYELGRWIMYNLDVDMLMQWWKSNVYCITISPKPRRVWLEWCPKGEGDGNSNKRTYMGEYYWNKVYPNEHQPPKFGPSASGGRMFWN